MPERAVKGTTWADRLVRSVLACLAFLLLCGAGVYVYGWHINPAWRDKQKLEILNWRVERVLQEINKRNNVAIPRNHIWTGYDHGEVVSVHIGNHKEIRDITPLSDLDTITELNISGTGVTSLASLVGVRVRALLAADTKISDLSPLVGMPLVYLDICRTDVTDLTPLRGMALQMVALSSNKIADLSPLKTMPIYSLSYHVNSEKGFSVLRTLGGSGLTNLEIFGAGECDLAILCKLPLRALDIRGSRGIVELTGLKGLSLHILRLDLEPRGYDLSPLEGMPLSMLTLRNLGQSDFTPLRHLPLKDLYLHSKLITDISALRGLSLLNLDLSGCRVSDISPLKGMSLNSLDLRGNPVRDISALEGMKLLWVDLSGTLVEDISSLGDIDRIDIAGTPAEAKANKAAGAAP